MLLSSLLASAVFAAPPESGVELVRLAVRSGLFPVVEVFDGARTVVNVEPDFDDDALERYFAAQGRFGKHPLDLKRVRESIARGWSRRRALASA